MFTVSTGVIVMGLASTATLWFRLCRERERRRYLLAASRLPGGSRVHEQRDDGTHLILIIGDRSGNESR